MPPTRSGLSPALLAERARTAARSQSPEAAISDMADLAAELIPCDHASLTLIATDGTVETPAGSDETVLIVDQIQYELAQGPCLSAAETGGHFLVCETVTDPRWPDWGARMGEMGLHSVLAVHLFTGRDKLGALNLYATRSDHFRPEDVQTAEVVAAHASVVLARARTERNLWAAVDARHVIGVAQGILMERYGLSQDRAFAVLKRHSQFTNRKLRALAVELVQTGTLRHDADLDGVSPA